MFHVKKVGTEVIVYPESARSGEELYLYSDIER